MQTIYVKHIKLEGNTVISNHELSHIISKYEDREITFEELQALRLELTVYYIDKGYITSGAVIPNQEMTDGTVLLDIIEGKITEVVIEGNKHLRSEYIKRRLVSVPDAVANVNELQKALLILQQNPLIKRINADLKPGVQMGESVLYVSLEENGPYIMGAEFNNSKPPSVGGLEGLFRVGHQSLTGNGDVLSGSFGYTTGLIEYDAGYSFPIKADDTTLKVEASRDANVIAEQPFNKLNIQSVSETYELILSRPFYRESRRNFRWGWVGAIGIALQRFWGSRSHFQDPPQETSVFLCRFFQEYIDQGPKQVFVIRSDFEVGTDPFEDINLSDPFEKWLGHRSDGSEIGESDWQTVFRTDVQLSFESLLPTEKFSIGGIDSVRGYREDRLSRDNGAASSIELRIPLWQNASRDRSVQLAPFADFGESWNTHSVTPDPLFISSAGLGLRCTVTQRFSFEIYGGVPFTKFHDTQKDIQDLGIHFRVVSNIF